FGRPVAIANLQRGVASFQIAEIAQAGSKPRNVPRRRCGGEGRENADERADLLRAHRERPRGCRAAKQRDELATFHGADPKAKDHRRSIAGVGVGQGRGLQYKAAWRALVRRACARKSAFCKRGSVNVRFARKATEVLRCREASLCAKSRHMQCSKFSYSITSSARARTAQPTRRGLNPDAKIVNSGVAK